MRPLVLFLWGSLRLVEELHKRCTVAFIDAFNKRVVVFTLRKEMHFIDVDRIVVFPIV